MRHYKTEHTKSSFHIALRNLRESDEEIGTMVSGKLCVVIPVLLTR